ncbi:recombinase family protein [Rhodococcus erythropolis]|uniref:recombinase family protein n=1 Tax=Rhodococcus erythropolis TaxID=1833 RepID=UPI0030137035
MTLVGLVRVSTDKQETQRQRDALDPIYVKVFEEKVSGTLSVDQRLGLQAALHYLRPDDLLTVQEVDRLGRNGLDAARKRGNVGGRPTVVDDDKRAAILARRNRGESIRTIASGVRVSVGTVHRVLSVIATDAAGVSAREETA